MSWFAYITIKMMCETSATSLRQASPLPTMLMTAKYVKFTTTAT